MFHHAVCFWHWSQYADAIIAIILFANLGVAFNLWTESYGGHYGPTFFEYFYDQNAAIAKGTQDGCALRLDSLGIGNGIIDMLIQAPSYPAFVSSNLPSIAVIFRTGSTICHPNRRSGFC